MLSKIKTCVKCPVNQKSIISKTGKSELAEGRVQWGREYFTTFQNTPHVISTFAPHLAKRRRRGTPQLPHEVPKFNTDFQGVIPAVTPTFSLLQILCRHRSSSWERKHHLTPPAERHRPLAPCFLLPSYQPKRKALKLPLASGTALPPAWGLYLSSLRAS